jgi:hypothetical protein
MKKKTINISKDFSPYPAGRYEKDGKYTGEGFRNTILKKALQKNDTVVIELDGTLGYGSSFLEEAFGGLIREDNFSEDDLLKRLELVGRRKSVIDSIHNHIHNAQVQKNITTATDK